jgi:hypothetical protein
LVVLLDRKKQMWLVRRCVMSQAFRVITSSKLDSSAWLAGEVGDGSNPPWSCDVLAAALSDSPPLTLVSGRQSPPCCCPAPQYQTCFQPRASSVDASTCSSPPSKTPESLHQADYFVRRVLILNKVGRRTPTDFGIYLRHAGPALKCRDDFCLISPLLRSRVHDLSVVRRER